MEAFKSSLTPHACGNDVFRSMAPLILIVCGLEEVVISFTTAVIRLITAIISMVCSFYTKSPDIKKGVVQVALFSLGEPLPHIMIIKINKKN
jgi:hypothetical protein